MAQGPRTGSPRPAGCGQDFRDLASSVKGYKVAGKLTHPHHDLQHQVAQRGEPTHRVGVLAGGLGVSGSHGTAGPLTSPASGQVPQPCPIDQEMPCTVTAPKCVEGRLAYKHNAAWSTSPPRIGRPSACVSSPRVPLSLYLSGSPSACVSPGSASACLYTPGPPLSPRLFTPGLSQPVSLHHGSVPAACIYSSRVHPLICVSSSRILISLCLFNSGLPLSLCVSAWVPLSLCLSLRVCPICLSLQPGSLPKPASIHPGAPSACVSHPGPSPQPASLTRVPLSLRLSPRVRSPACLQAHLLGVGTPGLSVPAFSAAVLAPIFQLLP